MIVTCLALMILLHYSSKAVSGTEHSRTEVAATGMYVCTKMYVHTGWPKKTSPTLRKYFQEVFLDTKVIFSKCIKYPIWNTCDEFYPSRSINFHVIRSDTHENKNCVFARVFIGTRERKHLLQPEPQTTVFSLRFHCPILFLIVSSDILSLWQDGHWPNDHLQRWALSFLDLSKVSEFSVSTILTSFSTSFPC